MGQLKAALLYGALALCANPVLASGLDKLKMIDPPAVPAETAFTSFEGADMDLSAYHGKVVVLNFWATWCAPCKREMPSLDRLNAALSEDDIEVVTMAFGRHNPMMMERFWQQAEISTLPLHRDIDTSLAEALGVKGLPYTVILDVDGRQIAALPGEAEWDAPEVVAFLKGLAD